MENSCGKSGINAGESVKESDKVINTSGTARSNDRHVRDLADRAKHFNVESTADTVGIDRIDNYLARAVANTALDPFDSINSRVNSPSVFEKAESSVNALDVRAENNTLASVAFSSAGDSCSSV